MTTTKAPMTAAEARELAERLTAQEKQAADRLEQARHDAEVAAWTHEYRDNAEKLSAVRHTAATAWRCVVEDPDATLPDLWAAFLAVRIASTVAFEARKNAARSLDVVDPIRNLDHTGTLGTRSRPVPADDAWSGLSFAGALDEVAKLRASRASQAERTAAAQRVQTATDTAAEGLGPA